MLYCPAGSGASTLCSISMGGSTPAAHSCSFCDIIVVLLYVRIRKRQSGLKRFKKGRVPFWNFNYFETNLTALIITHARFFWTVGVR